MIGEDPVRAPTISAWYDYDSGAVTICVLGVDYTYVLDAQKNSLFASPRCTAYCMQRCVHFQCAIPVLNCVCI
jgi:hypothetical protein